MNGYAYDTSAHTLTVTTTLPTYATTDKVYDADGELASQRDALGNTTTYAYNALGQAAQVADPSDSSILLGPVYNAVGEEVSSTDLLGNVTSGQNHGAIPSTHQAVGQRRRTGDCVSFLRCLNSPGILPVLGIG